MISRRAFLGTVPPALAYGCAPGERTSGRPETPVVDTHAHCFAGKEDARFPYHADAPYRPDVPATPQELLRCMDGAGVDFAVLVHPEPYQDDHRYLEHCLAMGKGRLKGTCLFFAGRARGMQELANRLPIVALRIHAYAPGRLPPFGKPELREHWKQAVEAGLAIQLHFEPRYAPGFEPLIREFSSAPVIIDHLGRPMQGTAEEHNVVVGWSRLSNTILKVSALPRITQYPHRDPADVVRKLADAFGADRMIAGGGFDAGATPESYRAERQRIRACLSHLPARDQAMALGGTAARLFRFA